MQGQRFLVLRALNQEHHQKRNDGRAGIDDELPRVGVVKRRSQQRPYDDDSDGDEKCFRTTGPERSLDRKIFQRMTGASLLRLGTVLFADAMPTDFFRSHIKSTPQRNNCSSGYIQDSFQALDVAAYMASKLLLFDQERSGFPSQAQR